MTWKVGFSQFCKQSKDDCYDFPVDLVYTWVDGNESNYRALRESWMKKFNIELTEDNNFYCQWNDHEELKYSIRSVEKYAPWIRNIYIVTYSQTPSWLVNCNNKESKNYIATKPTIKIVDLRHILPNDALPTFNSMAIETRLPFIDGLAEHFLYANDDMFINDHLDKSFFYDPKGRPIARLQSKIKSSIIKRSLHVRGVRASQEKVMKRYGKLIENLPHHCIDSYTKTAFFDCISDFQEDFDKTVFHKFRSEDSIQRSIVLYRAIATKQAVVKIIKKWKIRTDSLFIASEATKKLKRLENKKFKLFCINDDRRATESDRVAIDNFLKRKYPEKSIYEIAK